jgi:hypothetical protein
VLYPFSRKSSLKELIAQVEGEEPDDEMSHDDKGGYSRIRKWQAEAVPASGISAVHVQIPLSQSDNTNTPTS